LRDLLINAGGFVVGAAYNRVEVFRTVLSPTEKAKLELITLQVDTNYQLVNPTKFALQPYDQIVVRMTPEFTLSRTVELNGEVKYPGIYVLESKQTTLNDVIHMAGGLLKDADPYGAKLFRTYNNRGNITIQLKKVISSPNSLSKNPILFEGDVVNIGRMENTVSILETGTRMAQYTTLSDQSNIKNIVFQGRRSAKWYISNFAGGFQKNADRNSVTVTYPNNQMQSTKRYLIFFNAYPTVQPGSTITMRMDAVKIQKELDPKEKIDWESTLAKGLSTLMSTLSIILLMQRL
jgi:protein involved in polysaccharide export with SLBB domain